MREASRAQPTPHKRARDTAQRTIVTVLKADISGSTPLGERLDPEELRAVLGSYFAALAREIHRRGGVVDKYIGDAVIAVFGVPEPRDDDAARAVVAAVAMQEAIGRENIELRRRYGVQLACRIGIATGTVVGGAIAEDVQATYTVVGAPVTLAEALESAAPLGSVLVSPATRMAARGAIRFAPVEQVRPKASPQTIPAHRVLGLRHATRELANVMGAVTSASLQVTTDRPHVLAEERKVVTVLFADISSSEPLGATLDPSKLRMVLGAYFGVLARAIQHYGGTVDKYIGDAVMAVFGAPVSHEDDGVRAIRAALAIQRSAQSLNATLEKTYGMQVTIRIGINTGEVVAGLLPGEVLAYTVTGDAVNTAQRIQSVTAAGDVLVSESTRSLARNAFVYESVPPLTLKGKSQPVPAYRVTGTAEKGSTPAADQPALVGREIELGRLHELFALARSGAGQVVHVHGEAGVGKSRLIGEFLSTLPSGAGLLRAQCSSYETATPYAVVADLFRRAFEISAADDEPTARAVLVAGAEVYAPVRRESAVALLLEVLGFGEHSALPPERKRQLLGSLLRELVVKRSRPASVMLVEDVHWIDPTSADLLREVRSAIARLKCLMLSTSRDESAPWPTEALPLQPLESNDAARMVDRIAGEALDPKLRVLVLERTGGNPFFIEEVVRSIRETGASTVPETVQDVLEARLDRLDEAPRMVAHRASIIGRTFWTRVLERVTPLQDLDVPLRTLETDHFIALNAVEPERTYSFAHALVQEVAYRTQLISQRRHGHVAVGDAIGELFEGRLAEFVDVLAYHYGRGDHDEKARIALLRAGKRAQHLYATEEALAYYRQAIERSGDDAETRATAEEAIGDVLRAVGRYVEALVGYERARHGISSEVRDARLERKKAVIEHLRGHTESALATFERVLATLPETEAGERARTLLNLGEVRWRLGQYTAAVEALERASAEAERARDDDALAEVLKQLGSVLLLKGDIAAAVREYHRSLALYESLGDALGQANSLNNIGAAFRRQSRLGEALLAYERSLAIRERIGDQLGITHSRNNLGEIHFLRGDLEQAERNFSAAVAVAEAIGYVGLARVGLGATRVERGDSDNGRRDLLAAVRELEGASNRTYLADALRDLAHAFLPDQLDAALDSAERAVSVARGLGSDEKIGAALTVLGRVRLARGDHVGAITVLEEAHGILDRVAERQETARAMAALAQAYRRVANDDPRNALAEELTERARAIFKELGAELDLRRLEAALGDQSQGRPT